MLRGACTAKEDTNMIATPSRRATRALALAGGVLAAVPPLTGVAAAAESSMAHMGSTAAPHTNSMHGMSMGGASMSVGSHTTNILPNWLAVIWTLAFLAIIVIHWRHVLESEGQRRVWHSGHVFM